MADRKRQNHLQAGAAGRASRNVNAPVVGDDDLLNQSESEPGAAAFSGEEGSENALSLGGGDTGTVVIYRDSDATCLYASLDRDVRSNLRARARLNRIAKQVAERLAQE